MTKRIFFATILGAACFFFTFKAGGKTMPFHCPQDTAEINLLIGELKSAGSSLGDKITAAAMAFADSPEDDYYSTDSIADLRLNIDSFTPLMLVNNAIALARAADYPGSPDWRTFQTQLENIACRKGENNGFTSIMYHTSDWIGDNTARGNVRELTEDYPGVEVRTKSLDEMTRNRSNYAALSDSLTFETVRMTEMGFRTHRIPTLKRETIKKREMVEDLRSGDILILVPYGEGKDFYDMGIVTLEQDGPHLIHLSPQTRKVEKEAEPLARYLGPLAKYYQGIRLVRVKD